MSDKHKKPLPVDTESYYKSMEEFVREQEVKRLLKQARAEEAALAEAAHTVASRGVMSLVDVVLVIIVVILFLSLLTVLDC